jgi:hypothetical protein
LGHDHEEAETGVGEEMKEHFLILGDLSAKTTTTAAAGGREWEAALRGAATAAVPGLDRGQEALQVAVWGAASDPFFFPDAAAGEESGNVVPFKVREYV